MLTGTEFWQNKLPRQLASTGAPLLSESAISQAYAAQSHH